MKYLLWAPIVLFSMIGGCKKDQKMTLAALTTMAASSITSNSAQLGGSVSSDGGSNISQKGIVWATHSLPTVSDSVTNSGTGNSAFTTSVSDLMSNITYYARSYAINADGTGYGNEVSFTTSKGVPGLTTTAITNNMALTAQSGGDVISDGGAAVTVRGVCWSTSPHPTILNSKKSDSVGGTGLFTDTLLNLIVNTYYVRAFATNSYGTGYGNEITFTVSTTGTVTDIDGNVYGTVTIGSQVWMTSNLKATHYQNGDPIINALATNFNLTGDTSGAFTFPNGDSSNNAVYGKLYNQFSIMDPRNIAPEGWHVPTDAEWQLLEFNEGMSAVDTAAVGSSNRGDNVGPKLIVGGSSGLNLQNAGYCSALPMFPGYFDFNVTGYFATSTFINVHDPSYYLTYNGWARAVNYVYDDPGAVDRNYGISTQSVRCVKN